MTTPLTDNPDVVLIGAGIMSATLGTLLYELDPTLNIHLLERLGTCGQESSQAWNNAGTGHAGNCEMNYTPQRPDGSVDIAKALQINTKFDLSRQLWSYLVAKGAISDPRAFIHPCPHMSFVQGEEDIAFLRQRFAAMSAHHCYQGMEFSDNKAMIGDWAPLIMEGRDPAQPVAATRMATGTDVDYGSLTRLLTNRLAGQCNITVSYSQEVKKLKHLEDGRWLVTYQDAHSGEQQSLTTRFVFIGAGGAAIELLQMSGIPEGQGYGGFPISGLWLRCEQDDISSRHRVKVYGKAASGSPPMSVPHLDARIINGQRSLLFGPYAGFSSKFLKNGPLSALFHSLTYRNIVPLLDVAKDNLALTEYLIGQVFQSRRHQFEVLKQFFPNAQPSQWTKVTAGQRVQIIKPDAKRGGILEFGTELVPAADGSLVALLGASPGASTAASIALDVLHRCFAEQMTEQGWLPALRRIFPTYGLDLNQDKDACLQSRQETARLLQIENIG